MNKFLPVPIVWQEWQTTDVVTVCPDDKYGPVVAAAHTIFKPNTSVHPGKISSVKPCSPQMRKRTQKGQIVSICCILSVKNSIQNGFV